MISYPFLSSERGLSIKKKKDKRSIFFYSDKIMVFCAFSISFIINTIAS